MTTGSTKGGMNHFCLPSVFNEVARSAWLALEEGSPAAVLVIDCNITMPPFLEVDRQQRGLAPTKRRVLPAAPTA